ncbi:MAG: DUF2156 domain-containing protein [Gemmatimonadales bacterium]
MDSSQVQRARDLVMEHGWNATSYQIVNPGIEHWFSARGDAVVGFARYAGFRVVAGAPVCSFDRLSEVVQEFENDAKQPGHRVVYFGSEERLESTLPDSPSHSRALLGAQPAWNPSQWDALIASHASLRAQLTRATNKGVRIAEMSPRDASKSDALKRVLNIWLENRGLPPLHFLVEPDTFARLDDRRVFVAHQEHTGMSTRVVAFAVLSPIAARNGWLVEQFPRVADAPNGTVELLLSTAVKAIAEAGSTYVTLGLAPLAMREQIEHPKEPLWLRAALKFAALHGRRFYNFAGLYTFKAKFSPETWEPVYAIEAASRFSAGALYAIAGVFASRSPIALVSSAIGKALTHEMHSIFTISARQ